MKYLLVILLLAGCATKPEVRIEYRVVDVPVPPVIETPERGSDPGTPDGRARVIARYVEELKQALRNAQIALDVYRK